MTLSFRLPHQSPVCVYLLPCTCHIPHLTSSIWSANNILWGVHIKLLIMKCSKSHITSSHLSPNIPQTLFSNILMLHSSLHMRDELSPTHKTKSEIMVLHSLTFTFLHSNCEHKRFCIQSEQPFHTFNTHLISPWMPFWLASVIHKHLNFPTFSKNLLVTYKLWSFCILFTT